MNGLAGLWSQSLAGPLLRPGQGVSRGLIAPPGLVEPRRLALSRSAGSLDNSSTSSTISTLVVTITPARSRRSEQVRGLWRQILGPAGTPSAPHGLETSFLHSGLGFGTHQAAWRFDGYNQFGDVGVVEVAYALTRYEEGPPQLLGGYSPTTQQLVTIDPTTRQATVYFSAWGSGGVPPYSYNWGGGDFPNSAANQATFYIPPGATQGIDFGPGCTISDSAGQSITVGPCGPFFIYEGP